MVAATASESTCSPVFSPVADGNDARLVNVIITSHVPTKPFLTDILPRWRGTSASVDDRLYDGTQSRLGHGMTFLFQAVDHRLNTKQ